MQRAGGIGDMEDPKKDMAVSKPPGVWVDQERVPEYHVHPKICDKS